MIGIKESIDLLIVSLDFEILKYFVTYCYQSIGFAFKGLIAH